MPIKKGKNKGKLSNIEIYNQKVEASKEKVLDLQHQINILAEKQFVTGEKLTKAEEKYTNSLQIKLDSMVKTRNLLGR